MFIQGQEPLTASMLAAAPLMDQKQLLGAPASFSAAPVSVFNYRFVTIRRRAAVPADQRPPPKPGWKNHRDAAGD